MCVCMCKHVCSCMQLMLKLCFKSMRAQANCHCHHVLAIEHPHRHGTEPVSVKCLYVEHITKLSTCHIVSRSPTC